MLGNNLAVLDVKTFKIPEAHAQEVAGPIVDTPMEHDEIGLIALLVESDLLEDQAIKSRIKTYARNAQERTPHSQSLIIKVDKNEETYNVAKLLEKLYFEGIDTDVIDGNPINNNSVKEDNNKLIGIVVIGDVPIPVVTESGGDSYPSMYPYTDFYRKRFIYNHETDKFEENSDVPFPNPEVWHGVIVPPSKDAVQSRTELIEYFDKNEKYSDGDSEFTDFNKRMLYLNHPAMEKKMNYMDFGNYLRYIAFMEEMSFNRYNKHLLKELIKWVSSDMGAEEPVMPDEAIDAMLDVSTEFIFKQYTSPLAMALKIYRGQLNGAFKDTGRWYGNKVDTADELITYRDEYAKTTLRKKQLMLEKEVDDFIKEEVPAEERKAEITTSAELKIKTDIPVIGEGTKHYTFFTYIDGKKVSEMNTVEDCGINVGQERGADEEVLENNSVYVEANRMYNPETLIEPPNDEDWKLEEDGDYIDYAGCVFNNSYEIDTGKMLLSPSNCNVRMSNKPIFDIVGSKEIEDETGGNRCSYSRMTFSTGDDGVFNNNAKSGGASEVKLKNVINHVYGVFVNDGTITEKPDISMREKASDVVKALVNTGRTIHYEPDIPLLDVVDMYISAEINGTGEIDDYSTHVEPTNETIQAIKQEKTDTCGPNGSINFPQIVTPSTPADGIRYTEFQREDEKRRFDYMNLYRIGGNNIEEIENNLEEEISSKEVELEQAVGTPTNLLINSFAEGIDADNNIIWKDDIDEPIIWNTLNVDQKLANIIQKYTDRDSVMPTPNYIVPHIPQMKPNGYEVLHIVAEGDPWGYTYGLNRAMVNQMQGSEFGEATVEDEQGDGVGDSATTGDEGGGNDDENNYVCGDPKGVEIWEWFDALQCWIEEEILPASELFKLDETCGTLATAPENQQEEIAFPDPMDDTTTKAVDIEAEMDRKSLVVGQEESIFVYPINANGNSVMGYLDEVVHLELADSSLGSFSKNDFHFFKGEDEVKFTAEKTGTTQLRITMGDIELQPAITIHIYDSINLHWSSELQQSGNQNSYKINVDLRTPSGDQVTDVNTVIYLAPAKPTDGGFTNKGKNQLVAGEGETEFVPMAGPTKIDLIEKDPFYTSAPYSINPPASPAVKLAVDSPGYIEIGETKEIPITAVSTFGTIATGFNNNITISLSEDTEKYAKVITANVQMVNGKGKAIIQGGKDTADIKIIAEYPNLQSGEGAIPILARVDSEDWMGKYPQNLFASFVGFPAGDFFEENYFGGIHLFNGKTEAVYSFLTGNNPAPEVYVMPNYQVKTTQPQQKVYLEFPNNQILLQVFDQIKLQTLLSKNIQLNFNEVIEWEEESKLEVNKMYVEVLSDIFTSKTIENGIELLDYEGNEVLRLQKNNIDLINPSYSFYYNNEPELDVLEIILSDGSEDITRVMLNFEPVQMEPENFNEISDKYVAKKVYSGNGTNKPNGLILYNPAGDMPEDDKGEYFGLQGENNYLQLFAGGSSAGESTRFNLPANAVLLGDPTIQLDLSPSGGLDYDYSKGRKIFQDPNGSQIASMTYFNFNNDAYEDVALVMKDGRVRLMEGGPTEPEYRDRGDIAFLSDGAVAIEAFDFQKDGYEDLVVGTNEGRLAILNNDKELISRTNQDIKIGKQLYQLRKGDMDADGEEDLTVLDSRGDILVFYYENGKFKENGKLLGNYGFSIKDTNLYKDLEIRYQGLATPNTTLGLDLSALPDTEPGTPVLEASDSQLDAITNLINGNASNPSEDDSKALIEAAAALQEAIKNNPEAAAGLNGPPMLPWAEDDQTKTYFEPAENLSFLTITKTVRNKDRPDSKNVDLEEKLIYNITITSSINLSNFVIADTVPDSLSADMTTINCSGVGCPEMLDTQESGIRMFIGEMNLKANQPLYLDYEASVKHTPQAAIMVQKLTQPNAINDQYLDVIVSPPYNNTQDFIQHYSTGSRSYSIRSTSEDAKPPSADLTAILDNNSFIEALTNFSTQEFSGDNPPD
ncbi:hypothetical protein JW758_02235, partial [Candidatus Peregrinibacteria bacterium]|nr:hypothetical protein [Candidatus Peregrinibacteria bacterium]